MNTSNLVLAFDNGLTISIAQGDLFACDDRTAEVGVWRTNDDIRGDTLVAGHRTAAQVAEDVACVAGGEMPAWVDELLRAWED